MLSQNILAMSDVVIIQFNGYFPDIETMNLVPKIDHNSACGHLFLLKLLLLNSTQKGLSIHAKNSTFSCFSVDISCVRGPRKIISDKKAQVPAGGGCPIGGGGAIGGDGPLPFIGGGSRYL